MAIGTTWETLETLQWSNRDPQEFFSEAVKSAALLNRFTIYDGIKSKEEKSIFKAELVFDDKVCTWEPASKADIDEKEFTTHFKRWGFQNCKDKLEDTFRSQMLTKGQLNEETLDAQFAEWVFDYFVKLNGAALLNFSWNGDGSNIVGIKAEALVDADVVDVDGSAIGATLADSAKILDHMKKAYESIPEGLYSRMEGNSDKDYAPVIFLPVAGYKAYKMATASYTNGYNYDPLAKGDLERFMGMEVVMYHPLAATEMLITPPSNLVMATDDVTDKDAIQTEYDKKTNSDNIWGQYKVGFSYKMGDEIIHYTTA
jgi:hypothetical protein